MLYASDNYEATAVTIGMIVDGKAIAERVLAELREKFRAHRPGALAVVLVGNDPVSRRFVSRKVAVGKEIGVPVRVEEFPANVSEEELRARIETLAREDMVSGIIVQLPLPPRIDTAAVLAWIPPEKDVDALSPAPRVPAPVAGAVNEILRHSGVVVEGRQVVVIGRGRLVGKPVADWFRRAGADVCVASTETSDLASHTCDADIIVSGVGRPRLITPDMVKEGAVLIDAGTSESEGKLVGDIHPDCAKKASVFTPVPGGIGPVTVAILFENLFDLSLQNA